MTSLLRRVVVGTAVGVAAIIAVAPTALAHGDPSSHYLETGLLYPAVGDPPTQSTELALLGLLSAAADRGYPIKVALVANEQDLTEDATMLTRPQAYADFVAGELNRSGALRGPVLVVTPSGFGLAGNLATDDGGLRALEPKQAASLVAALAPVDGQGGEALATAADAATRQLAAASGRALPAYVPPAQALQASSPAVAPDESGGWNPWWGLAVFGGVFLSALLVYEVQRRFARADQPADQPPVLSHSS